MNPVAPSFPPDSARVEQWSWTGLAIAVLLMQTAITWDLWRTRVQPDGRGLQSPIIALATLVLTTLLCLLAYRFRRRVAREARQAGDQLDQAMEFGHAVGWDWDVRSGRDVFFGDLKSVFGIDARRHLGHVEDFRRYIHPDDRAIVWRAVNEAREKRTTYGAIFRVVTPERPVRWLSAMGRFSYGADGAPVRMLGIATDITERHAIENELRDSQEQLMAIIQSAMDAIIAIDDERRITVFNPAAARMFGCAVSDALGASIDRFIPERFRPAHAVHVRRFGESDTTRRTVSAPELRALRADGRELPIQASIAQATVAGRKLYTAILRDDTERRKAEDALRESEERFRLMADTAPVMLWMSGPDKLCTYFNRVWLEFTGRPLESELGDGWADNVHPDDVADCLGTYDQAFKRRATFSMEYRLRRRDGEYRWVFDSRAPRFNSDGSFAGYIGSAVDVTMRKIAEEALAGLSQKLIEAHETERTRIARELHDDIGQRMAVLTMDLDGMHRALPEAAADLRRRIATLSSLSIALAKDIQAMSHTLHSSKLDHLGLASAVVVFCRELSEQHNVRIDFSDEDFPTELPKTVALCLFRVLQEAVTNALRHAAANRITVALRGGSDEIRLVVADDGMGFDPEAALRGPGLGLTSMRERLSLVAGDMHIETGPGAGTTIRARVPGRHAPSPRPATA